MPTIVYSRPANMSSVSSSLSGDSSSTVPTASLPKHFASATSSPGFSGMRPSTRLIRFSRSGKECAFKTPTGAPPISNSASLTTEPSASTTPSSASNADGSSREKPSVEISR